MVKKHRIISIDGFIHILSDEEIKEGNWVVFHGFENRVFQTVSPTHDDNWSTTEPTLADSLKPSLCKKIIATTDPKLVFKKESDEYNGYNLIPRIPQSLVEYYAKHQPEEVELEYDYNDNMPLTTPGSSVYRLKLQNNEVVWVEPIKGKMALVKVNGTLQAETLYTREEVEELTHIAFLDGALANLKGKDMGEYWKWKKKNL